MLIAFRVENYLSFGEEQRLSMIAGSVKNHSDQILEDFGRRAVCMAAVFGANSSGKTNLVRAMGDTQAKIVRGTHLPVGASCRSNDVELPAGFEYTFSTGSGVYAYGFEIKVSTDTVVSEWLYETTSAERCLYEREGDDIVHHLARDEADEKLDLLAKLLAPGGGDLLLPILARMNDEEGDVFRSARAVMEWFRDRLIVVPAGGVVPARLDDERDDIIRRVLSSYDTGVTDLAYERMESLPKDMPKELLDILEANVRKGVVGLVRGPRDSYRFSYDDGTVAERIVFYHDGRRFEFSEESDGTRRLYDLVPILQKGMGDGLTIVVDEIDRSLHPQLTQRLVRDFLSIAKGCGRQLIATTHESRLLDLDLLRRDEIWFVERTGKGSSLYSLEEFRERGDRRVERSYMDGRYGAVPCFRRIYPDLE